MTDERRDDLFDEGVLRRALQLEDDERAPRFDARAIAAAATPRVSAPFVLAATLIAVAIALTASIAWADAIASAAGVAGDALDLSFDALAAGAAFLYPIAQTLGDPVVPLSLLAAIAITIHHETRMRREHAHAQAS